MNVIGYGSAERIRPADDSPRGAFGAVVKENRKLCTDHFRLILSLGHFPASVPGQFVQLDCREAGLEGADVPREFEWGEGKRAGVADADFVMPVAYLRRPFSIADRRDLGDGSVEIDIIHRVVGRGTSLLARLEAGQSISLLGPLGIGFPVAEDLKVACLVGGGVGIPPMLYLAQLVAKGTAQAVAFLGAQRKDLLAVTLEGEAPSATGVPVMNCAELTPYRTPTVITTDDGSLGMKGYVTGALREFLKGRGDLRGTVVYCCGPTPMMKATAKVAAEFGVACLVSLEQPMACGMGTCQSCIIKYKALDGPPTGDWAYKLTCTHGPVFDTRDIVW